MASPILLSLRSVVLAATIWFAAPVGAASGEGAPKPCAHCAVGKIGGRPLSELGDDAIRFSSEPALGGLSIVVEIRPELKGSRNRVSVAYLSGHPSSGWRKLGDFHFWISHDDFMWLLGEVERAEHDDGADDSASPFKDGDDYIVVCTDGPGYLTEIRSKGRSRWISGFCGRNANNAIAPLMGRLVQYGTGLFLKHLNRDAVIPLRGGQEK